ncbi:hypothetical protein GGF31_008190 [Allomyces arbusculus]|nr:hypothetical protein GGF31_008190 [Allomyces arbusculus]
MAAATDFSDLLADLTAHPAVTGTLLFLNPVQRAPRPATALLHGPDVAVFDQDPKKDDDAARAWWDHLFPWTQTGSTPTNPSSLSFPVAGSPMVFHTIQLELSWCDFYIVPSAPPACQADWKVVHYCGSPARTSAKSGTGVCGRAPTTTARSQ